MDESAFNYNPDATINDDTCLYLGCLDQEADNFNPNANTNDGSCEYWGCTDSSAWNFDVSANTDDGSCCYIDGCTDSEAFNYNETACFDDGSCIAVLEGCIDSEAWNFDVSANTDDGSCYYDSPFGDVPNTDCNATILLDEDLNINIDGTLFANSLWLGVFYTDPNDNLILGGAVEWNGITTSIAAWGSESGLNNGFQSGEMYTWYIYNTETNEFIEVSNITMSFGDNNYTCNGLSGVSEISINTNWNQTINLPSGWSIMSTYLDLDNPDLVVALNSITDDGNLQIIKNGSGLVYWPQFNLNSIGDFVPGEGYQIKLDSNDQLVCVGELISSSSAINLPNGWSIVAYLHQESADATEMMVPIVDNIVIVKNGSGLVYWPQFNLNNIGNMNPGEGYQIKLNTSTMFSYPNLTSSRYSFANNNFTSSKYNKPKNTGNNMTIAIPNDIWLKKPSIGDEIVILDQVGLIVGNDIYREEGTVITIWGDDLTTDIKDGLEVGEKFIVKLLRTDINIEEYVDITSWQEGSGVYSVNGISIAASVSQNIVEEKQLIKVTDVLGRDVNADSKQSTLLYIYDDGSIEKKYILK